MTDRVAPPAVPPSLSARIDALIAHLAGSGPGVTVTAPFTGTRLARLPTSTGDDVAAAARRARTAQRAWAATPAADRAAVLLRLHDLVLAEQDALMDLIQTENGKARRDAFEEVADVAVTARYYARTAPRLLAPRRRAGAIPLLTSTVERRHPVGLVGLITPWNYPLTLGVSDALPALAAGNAVLHKPDTQTVLTALAGRELAVRAGLPAELWQVVVGDGGVVGPMVIDSVDHVVFTGSTATGRAVAGRAAGRLIGASLELGGKNPLIVCADAPMRATVAGAVRAAFASTGQLCLSAERIYVHADVADEFVRRFAAAAAGLRVGVGYDDTIEVGSLTSRAQLERVAGHVDDAVAAGATVLAGGRARPDLGPYCYEPTVLTGVPTTAHCYAEETFGPVVAVTVVASDDEAVQRANDGSYGLNASVWTRDVRRAASIAARLRAGTVNVNEAYAAAWGSIDAPMGGQGDSGLGRRHGAQGLLQTTWPQTVASQRWWPIGERPPLTGRVYRRAMTAALRVLKRTRRT